MRDYEDLVTSLRYCAEYDCTTVCPRAGTGNGCITRLKKEAADAIEDLIFLLTASNEVVANRRPKWISVEERLPKNELETYWVYTSVGSQHSCRWTNNRFGLGVSDKWGWSVFDIPQYTVVTHWMPLPSKEGLNET